MEIRTTNLGRGQDGNALLTRTLSPEDDLNDIDSMTPAQGVEIVVNMLRIQNAFISIQSNII
jgi:hypothetical protein